MFTIDLLKGQGIPIKSRPEGIAIVAIALAVPLIAAMVMIGYFTHSKVVMSIQKQRMLSYQTKAKQLSSALDIQKAFESEKKGINVCITEASASIERHSQWSRTLVGLVENLPSSLVMTELSVKQRSVRLKVPKADDPKKTIDITVPARTLQINVSGRADNNLDEQIRDYRNAIRSFPLLEQKLKDVRVSQGSGTLDDEEVVSYEVDCIFKPQL